jgi:hypothetical protein
MNLGLLFTKPISKETIKRLDLQKTISQTEEFPLG